MDYLESCKGKVLIFRIKELKDVLGQLGLAKQGKKQDLVERILALLSDDEGANSSGFGRKTTTGKEEVAKIINDTYRKMQAPGAAVLATKSNSSDLNLAKPKQEAEDVCQLDMKVRCLCGSSLITDSMIKCEDSMCHFWQHVDCVVIPENSADCGIRDIPSHFYCERCRLKRADPFWVTTQNPLSSVKLTPSSVAPDGSNTVQTMEKTFHLSRSDRDMLQKAEFDLQVWCILLNDKVPFRMQWPQFPDLQVNGVQVRATNRPGTQLLGINGRDDGPLITTCSREGVNKISFSRCDTRVFCLGIRFAKRKTVQQVLSMIPEENDGEQFEDALSRVFRCIGGGAAKDNADSDSDLEVVAESVTVNLRCPMSGSRMRTAGRFKPCVHMGCFDLDSFVELNQRSRKWQCPVCLKNYSLENLVIDPYFNRITSLMRNYGEDVTEIDVKPDGSWRIKCEAGNMDLAQWHHPDGTLQAKAEVKPHMELSKQIKQEGASEGHTGLKLGIKRNPDGRWEVSKHEDSRLSSENHGLVNFQNHNVIRMSSSATGSCRDGEDASVNQEGGGHIDLSGNNAHELDSLPMNIYPAYVNRITPASVLKDTDIVVLSDSDDDNLTMISQATRYDSGPAVGAGAPFHTNHPGVSESVHEDLGLGTSATAFSLFNNGTDEFGTLWPVQTCPQGGAGFQLFDAEADALFSLVNAQSSLPSCTQANGFDLSSDVPLGDSSKAQDHVASHPSNEMNGTLVDNPLAFCNDDPSLQIFLPSQPTGCSLQSGPSNQSELPNGTADDWISLSLAAGGGHNTSPSDFGTNAGQDLSSKQNGMDALANTASLFLSMSDDRSHKPASNQHVSNNIFSHPRQQRSVRPRLYFSIDSDSD